MPTIAPCQRDAANALAAGAVLVTVLAAACTPAAVEPPRLGTRVHVAGGELEGSATADGEVLVWKGVPYAAGPSGDLRWRAPQPAPAWTGLRPATAFGPGCMQALRPEGSFYGPGAGEMSEDCLYLNVWAPSASGSQPHPVMVWIHGGALRNGEGARTTYDGEHLARRGVVLVTINYRLGPFGFLAHPLLSAEDPHGSSGNYGLLDQVAALQWVHDNIAAFGGDPARVTIFGESAGSLSVSYLQASPLSAGLFQRAIGESGTALRASPMLREESAQGEPAERAGERFVQALLAGTPASLEAMRAAAAEQVLDTFRRPEVAFPSRGNVDGWFLTEPVSATFAAGRQHDVPVIAGWNADEGPALVGSGGPKTRSELEEWAHRVCPEHAGELLAVFPAATDDEARTAYLRAYGASVFGWGARRWAELMANVPSAAYVYHFTRVPPGQGGQRFGAYHASEISYVFDNLDRPSLEGEGVAWTPADRAVADRMASYWVQFATTGDPNGPGLPEWPAYQASTDRTMVFGDPIEVRTGVRKEELDVFELCSSGDRD